MKRISPALCFIIIAAFHASAEDGITSGKVFSPQDKTIQLGDYVSLKENGKTVYYRLHSKSAKDFEFLEQFIVDGKSILEIRHLKGSVGFIFLSHKDYMATTSMTNSKVDKISISSIKEDIGYTWKRDSEGFYSIFSIQSSTPRHF